MASIDERVVAMSFENAKFEQGVAQTMATLTKLDAALRNIGATAGGFAKIEAEASKVTLAGPIAAIEKLRGYLGFPESKKAFSELEADSQKVTFGGITGAIEKVQSKLHFPEAKAAFDQLNAADDKVNFAEAEAAIEETAGHFSIITGAAAVAFGNLATQATLGVGKAVNATLSTIKQGFEDYELKIGATQTIMASTGEDIHTVSMYLKELDEYADRTIYSLRDMTSNIGKFTNAGVDLETSVEAMKGISNVAALSGANANEAARAMYNLGQAIGNGTVMLRDWRSVEIANMGTKEFKEELIKAAEAAGTLERGNDGLLRSTEGNIVNFKTFGETLQDDWLTAEALTKTLSKYADESTKLGKRAYAAATDVKTFSMMLETLAAAAGTGWTDTFELLFGNLPEATKLWTELTNAIGSVIGKSADMRNKILKDWKELGGRTELIDSFRNIFEGLGRIVTSVKTAFREFFPRKTGDDLEAMTANFKEFTENLIPSVPTMQKLHSIFEGFFAVLHIGWTILKQVGGVIGDLFSVVGENSGGFLDIAAAFGEWLTQVDKAVTKGQALTGIFESLGAVLRVPLEIISALASLLPNLFEGDSSAKAEGIASAMEKLNEALKPLRGVLEVVQRAWEGFLGILNRVREAVEPGFTKVLEFLGGFGDMIADRFNNINWDRAMAALQTGLIGGIFLKLKNALSGIISIDVGGSILKNLNEGLGALTNNLQAMQRSIQATTLLAIGAAILVLATGVFILSQIPADKLERAMTAVAVGLAQLIGAMVLLAKVGTSGFAQMPFIAGSMILLATAVTILAVAMKIMATMSWEELAKGLTGVAGALVAVGGATQIMNGPKLLVTAAALIPLAIGLNLLAVAVKIFSSMSWAEMGKGMYGVAVGLGAIALGVSLMPPTLLLTGAGLIAVSAGLLLMSAAIGAFGAMDLKTLTQGILGVATALVAIGYSVALIPPTLALQAAGLVILAVALNGIAAAVAIFGNMDTGTIAKGLITMSLALDVLALGLTAMAGTLPGSAALLAAAAAFAILGPAIAFMGQLKWTTLLKGLGAMALVLTVLAVAGTLAAAPITALGIALAALGGGMLVVSLALSLFILALAQLGDAGPKAVTAVIAAFTAFLLVLPKLIIDFIKGLVVIVAEIVKIAPEIVKSLVSIATTLLDAVVALAPKIAEAIAALVVLIAQVLTENIPKLAEAGFGMIVGLLTAIRDGLPQVMTLATEIVVTFLRGLAQNAPKIVQAGVETLVKFLSGVNTHLGKVVEAVGAIVLTFLKSVTAKIPDIVKSGVTMILTFLKQIANAVPKFIKAGVDIVLAFMDGIGDAIPRLVKKGLEVARKFLNGIADGLAGLADAGFKAVIKFLNGIEKAIRENSDELWDAGVGIGDAIFDGLMNAFNDAGPFVRKALEAVFDLLPGWVKKILGIKSPSTVFAEIGKNVMLGFVAGVENAVPAVKRTMEDGAQDIMDTTAKAFGDIPSLLDGIVDMEPVITPVLDLTNVEKDAKRIGELADVVPISAAASFDQASAISVPTAEEAAQTAQAGVSFEYNQYNTSPEKLSEIEIYRQTRNQLATVKTGLGLAT